MGPKLMGNSRQDPIDKPARVVGRVFLGQLYHLPNRVPYYRTKIEAIFGDGRRQLSFDRGGTLCRRQP